MSRWIRLNDDICRSCNQPRFVLIEPRLNDMVNILITCSCPDTMYDPYSTNWAQIDNKTVEDIVRMMSNMIQNIHEEGSE